MRPLAALIGCALVSAAAVGQSPGRIQVEVTEEIRAKPDACRLDFRIEARNADPSVAADEVADELKRVLAAFAALKVDGATLTPLPLAVVRQEVQPRNPRGVVLPAEVDFRVSRPLRLIVEGDDFAAVDAKVTKVQNALYAAGVKSNANGVEAKPAFYRKGGWEELANPAVERAAKRARAKAEVLTKAAGETLGGLESASQVNYISPADPAAPIVESVTLGDDNELVYRLRVRVVFSTK